PELAAPSLRDALPISATHPVKKSASDYVAKYEAMYGKGSVSTFGARAWDAGMLMQVAVAAALKKAQPGTAEFRVALRDALENTKIGRAHVLTPVTIRS